LFKFRARVVARAFPNWDTPAYPIPKLHLTIFYFNYVSIKRERIFRVMSAMYLFWPIRIFAFLEKRTSCKHHCLLITINAQEYIYNSTVIFKEAIVLKQTVPLLILCVRDMPLHTVLHSNPSELLVLTGGHGIVGSLQKCMTGSFLECSQLLCPTQVPFNRAWSSKCSK
jgi:hypothetical protein